MYAERFLTTVLSILSRSSDVRTTIANLASLGAEGLADWCGVYAFENDRTVRRLGAAPSPSIEALFPLDLHATAGPAYVWRTGERQMIENPGRDIAASLGVEPEELGLPDGGKPLLYSCLPAAAAGRTIGAVVFLSTDPARRFGDAEFSLAASLADGVGVAIDNSRLFRDAEEASRLKDEFVGMVSHELRTPLTPILGCIHLLRTAKLSPPRFERALEMIERNAHAQVQIVEDLLDASRIVAGKLNVTIKSTPLVPVLEAAIDTVRTWAEAKGVRIVTDFDDIRPPVQADPDRLQQIMRNLLSNAVKFTPAGGRVEISLRPDGDHVRIQVSDTGVGIPADSLPHIFDRFRHTSDANSDMRSGLGLGLALVRRLVEVHNGSIEAASSGPGQGAVFTLRFPTAARRAAGSDL
jgi:signal transduction histidine kinase